MSRAALEFVPGRDRNWCWGRPDEEYCADFCLIARRTLTATGYQVFKLHFLLGADWRSCTRRTGLDRGNFFHELYRVEEQLGRVFRELRPYSLFPLDQYFHSRREATREMTRPQRHVEFPMDWPMVEEPPRTRAAGA